MNPNRGGGREGHRGGRGPWRGGRGGPTGRDGRGGGRGRGRGDHNPGQGHISMSVDPRMIGQMLQNLGAVPVNVSYSSTQASSSMPPPPRPSTKKRGRGDNADDGNTTKSKKTKKGPAEPEELEEIDPMTCGNCGAQNHKAAFCVKTGNSGWMETCPKCDSARHLYDKCPQRKKGEEDFIYLIFNRQRKPPVKTTMKLGKVITAEFARPQRKFIKSDVLELPYSSKFARQEAKQNPPEAYNYAYVGDPTREAQNRIPEPTRAGITLGNAAYNSSLAGQLWSPEEEKCDPRNDGPMPTIQPKREESVSAGPSLQNIKNYTPPSRRERAPRGDPKSVRARSMLRLQNAFPEPDVCGNCGGMDHQDNDCKEPCSTCGSEFHAAYLCGIKAERV
ncbi:hypothetical protein F5Y07DRAFT_409259 [Xylaria sp. FL0933]|nr:hypothetical protein F5Y07DRAFT_409259 [Xylaria sp. FL0933]